MKVLKTKWKTFFITLAIACFVIGCASFETNVGKTVKGTADTVEYSRQAWTNYVWQQRANFPNPAERQDLERAVKDVGLAYAKYQRAMNALNIALTVYHNAPKETRDQQAVQTAIAALSAASGELIALVQSFYAK